jgi:hypothetical protein
MTFTLCPETGPPRVIRFVECIGRGLLAVYYPEKNVLSIDKVLYDTLSDIDKQRVLTTRHDIESVWIDGVLRIDKKQYHPMFAT